MKITCLEVVFSVIIVSVMVCFGVLISNEIFSHMCEDALRITNSVKVFDDEEKFDYIRRTNALDFVAEGTLSAETPVSLPYIEGSYSGIEKIKQRYTPHTRTRRVKVGKTHVTRTETYWSWDTVDSKKFECHSFTFLGQVFQKREFDSNLRYKHKKTIKESLTIRYIYNVIDKDNYGVMCGVADNKKYDGLKFEKDETIIKMLKDAENKTESAQIWFWVWWILFTGVIVFGFYYLENNWLYD